MTTIEPVPSMSVQLDISFRLARADDLPKLEWYGQYTHFREVFRRTYREQVNGTRLMLIADCNHFPIAQLFMQVGAKKQKRTYFYSFRVMEHFRGQGIGSRLLEEAETIALAYGYHGATIAAAKNNLRARDLYQRLGYRIVSEDEGRWSYNDHEGRTRHVHEPCWVLEKRLTMR